MCNYLNYVTHISTSYREIKFFCKDKICSTDSRKFEYSQDLGESFKLVFIALLNQYISSVLLIHTLLIDSRTGSSVSVLEEQPQRDANVNPFTFSLHLPLFSTHQEKCIAFHLSLISACSIKL